MKSILLLDIETNVNMLSDIRADRQMGGQTDGRTDRWTGRQTVGGQTYGRTDRRVVGHIDRQTDSQMDGRTDRWTSLKHEPISKAKH